MDFIDLIPDQERDLFANSLLPRTYGKGQVIYREGDPSQGLFMIERGLVGLVYISEKGAEHLLRLFRTGEYFGHRSFLAGETYHANSVCLEDTKVKVLPADLFSQLLDKYPRVLRFIAKKLAVELGYAERLRLSAYEKDVLSRTAEAILYLKEMHPDHLWTRREIAEFCSSTTPTVIRSLAKLEQMQLIQQSGRKIHIVDKEALKKLIG